MNTAVENPRETQEKVILPIDSSFIKTKKLPKRIVHFSDGILEEYSTDEEDVIDNAISNVDPKTLNWIPYLWYLTLWFGGSALYVCDQLGGYLAYFFGITTPKFKYEIEEFSRLVEKEKEKEKEDAEFSGWKSAHVTEDTTRNRKNSSHHIYKEPRSEVVFDV